MTYDVVWPQTRLRPTWLNLKSRSLASFLTVGTEPDVDEVAISVLNLVRKVTKNHSSCS